MNKIVEGNTLCKFLGLMISPLLGFLLAIPDIQSKSSRLLLYIFGVILGFSILVPLRSTSNNSFDSIRYREQFESYESKTSEDFKNELQAYVKFEGESDIYQTVLNYIVSRFSTNYHVLFLCASLIPVFFAVKSLKFLILNENYRFSIRGLMLLYVFLCTIHFLGIQAFRFYTALMLAVYSLIGYFCKRNKKYLIGLIVSPLIHASFLVMYPLLLFYYLFGRRVRFWIILMVIAFFTSELSVQLMRNVTEAIPFVSAHFAGYTDDAYMQLINEGGSGNMWIKRLYELIIRAYLNILIICMYINKSVIDDGHQDRLFRFLVVLMTFVNFVMIIPSLGSRFLLIVFPLLSVIWVNCFMRKQFDKFLYILFALLFIPFLLPFSILALPCLNYYVTLLGSQFFYTSPIVLGFRYLVF